MKYSLFNFIYALFVFSNVMGEEIAALHPISKNRSTTIQVISDRIYFCKLDIFCIQTKYTSNSIIKNKY